MRFVTDCVDYGDGATYFVSGVAAVEHAGVGTIEVTFYRTVTLPDGSVENRVAARQIWDRAAWIAAMVVVQEAKLALDRKPYVCVGAAQLH